MPIHSGTTITNFGISFLILNALLIFILERKYLLIPILLTSCYMTYGQVLVIGGFHFTVLRLMLLLCWIKILILWDNRVFAFNVIDKTVLAWLLCNVILNTILFRTYDAFQSRLGLIYDVVGLYGLFRFYIRGLEDIEFLLGTMSLFIIPLAILMFYESRTGINLYSIFGGIDEHSMVRNGYVRCQGPFRHPILAGTFGATLVPLFIALYVSGKYNKSIPLLGIASSLVIVLTSASSGPLMALIYAIVALIIWPFRDRMKMVRWGLFITIILLHLIMKAPVWFIIMRISDLVGGGGWHRSYLIDQAIIHFDEWWLVGTKYTAHWIPYNLAVNPDMVDITNAYLGNGVDGGLLTMILFVLIIVRCFQGLGEALKAEASNSPCEKYFIWAIGSALFSHVATFFSVSYFDQIIVFWYMLLAVISSIKSLQTNITDLHDVSIDNNINQEYMTTDSY